MKLSNIKPLNEKASAITIAKLANDLFNAIKHADGINPDHVDISLSKDDLSKMSILVKDWGNTQDTGDDDYDEHKQQVANEKELSGIVNKFQAAHSDVIFKIEFFEEGNFANIEISQAAPIIASESVQQFPEKELITGLNKAIAAFKEHKNSNSSTQYKAIQKDKGGYPFAIVWSWGHWREAHSENTTGPSHPSYLTQQDAERIVRELNKELKGDDVKIVLTFENDESLTLHAFQATKERPATDFI